MSTASYETMHVEGGRDVKMWTRGVPVEDAAKEQLVNTARMPFIFQHVAAMPDVHLGIRPTGTPTFSPVVTLLLLQSGPSNDGDPAHPARTVARF